MTPLTPGLSFRWGMFGSLLPEVLRFYKAVTLAQANPEIAVKFAILYTVVSLVFVVCAGLFTVAWRPENEFKAIWVGVSFPVLVSTLIQTAPTLPHP